MLGSITDSISNLAGNFVGNLADRLMDMAPDLFTNLMATAANTMLPGSGALVQAFAGPIVDAGFSAFESVVRDAVLPAASDALADAGLPEGDISNLINSLGNTFLSGVQQGWSG